MTKTYFKIVAAAVVLLLISSCTRGDKYVPEIQERETHTIFNVTIVKNTKSKSKSSKLTTKSDVKSEAKAEDDSKTTYDKEKNSAFIDSDIALGLVGVDNESGKVLVDNQPVFEKHGVRTADLRTSLNSSGSMNITAYYPYVGNVSYHKDGSYAISFTPNDIKKGPLASNAVDMRCDQDFETVNLTFNHITNSLGFKVCDITVDEQLRGLMHIRKVVLHGMPTEGMFVVEGKGSHWVPNARRQEIVIFDGDDAVKYGEENASFIGNDKLTDSKDECSRCYVVPEELKEGKHYVELFYDVEEFDYDETHYRGVKGKKQIIPLSGVIPDDQFETGLKYTFVLGMNLCTLFRPIEFTAWVDNWEFDCRIVDYDNE
jgi:hypothetical protein